MVVVASDDGDVKGGAHQPLGGRQPAESCSDDDNAFGAVGGVAGRHHDDSPDSGVSRPFSTPRLYLCIFATADNVTTPVSSQARPSPVGQRSPASVRPER